MTRHSVAWSMFSWWMARSIRRQPFPKADEPTQSKPPPCLMMSYQNCAATRVFCVQMRRGAQLSNASRLFQTDMGTKLRHFPVCALNLENANFVFPSATASRNHASIAWGTLTIVGSYSMLRLAFKIMTQFRSPRSLGEVDSKFTRVEACQELAHCPQETECSRLRAHVYVLQGKKKLHKLSFVRIKPPGVSKHVCYNFTSTCRALHAACQHYWDFAFWVDISYNPMKYQLKGQHKKVFMQKRKRQQLV